MDIRYKFPSDIKFRKSWRPYQQRVLEELHEHLDDDHLHIIAAPGSGKTVLGLEVVRLLNKPTLILSPTLAIRDQWVDRFLNLFCDSNHDEYDWISRDIRRPGFLTVSTYQGLHSAFTDKAQPGKTLITCLQHAGIRTMLVDEAHHLRSEWWKCLIEVKEKLDNPVVLALTATPPYDVTPWEWQRYKQLCGPVDTEIYVPELVQQDNLCPHQDYVYLSTPLQDEEEEIAEFYLNVNKVLEDLIAHQAFADTLEKHPCVQQPQKYIETILDDPGFYTGMAIFLHKVKSRSPNKLLHIIGIKPKHCPEPGLELMEALLTGCIFTHREDFVGKENIIDEIADHLRRIGAIERKTVTLKSSNKVARLLLTSCSKLKSISNIVQLENHFLGKDLRMVVLTDFIRKADLPKNPADIKPLKRLGVVPIFEELRRASIDNISLGVLSGSLVMVPASAQQLLEDLTLSLGIFANDLKLTPLAHDERFFCLDISGPGRSKIIKLITDVFNHGGITVLVGTKSLLGEGWDAPSINTLVLASFVGSYMLSNQMRGRAIRTQPGNPEKSANIWHLVCLRADAQAESEDLMMLTRRFKAFVGVSFKENIITNGLDRLNMGPLPFTHPRIDEINENMKIKAIDRKALSCDWQRALAAGSCGRMVEEISFAPLCLPRPYVFRQATIKILVPVLSTTVFLVSYLVRLLRDRQSSYTDFILFVLMALGIIGFIITLPRLLKSVYLLFRHRRIESSIKSIANALLKSLVVAGVMETSLHKLSVKSRRSKSGHLSCSLIGGTTYEKSVFYDAMEELLGPIENPRYLLVQTKPLGWLSPAGYFAVPQVLGCKKEHAAFLRKMWSRYVGDVDLIYTRTIEGRKNLLKARGRALSAPDRQSAQRLKSWQ